MSQSEQRTSSITGRPNLFFLVNTTRDPDTDPEWLVLPDLPKWVNKSPSDRVRENSIIIIIIWFISK